MFAGTVYVDISLITDLQASKPTHYASPSPFSPFSKWRQKSGFEMYFAPAPIGVVGFPTKTRLESCIIIKLNPPCYLSLALQGASLNSNTGTLTVGATHTIKNTITLLSSHAKAYPAFGVLAEHMKRIASVQIRSVASWAGNIMLTRQYPTFASDMATILGAAGAVFNIMDAESGKTQALSVVDLFAAKKDVLLISMNITAGPTTSVFQTFKTSQRHVFAHAIVNFGGYMEFEAPLAGRADGADRVVKSARIVVGGACQTLLVASETAAIMSGAPLNNDTLSKVLASLAKEIVANPSEDLRNTMVYRYAPFDHGKVDLPSYVCCFKRSLQFPGVFFRINNVALLETLFKLIKVAK